MRNIQRRHLLIATAVSLASPFALAQKRTRPPVLGILNFGRSPTPEEWSNDPRAKRLRELGWVEGKNIFIEHAYAEGQVDRLAGLAAELVRKKVDVILVGSTRPSVAAVRATKSIPIIFYAVGFPVELGLVPSLARPSGNVTGDAWFAGSAEQVAKPLEFLKEIAPSAKRLAWIGVPSQSFTVTGGKIAYPEMFGAVSRLGFEFQRHFVERDEDLEALFAAILTSRAQAIMIASPTFAIPNRQRIIDFANRHRLPSASDAGRLVDLGGLVSYAPYVPELERSAIDYVDRVLRGTPPADLPVQLPTKFELAVNLKTAKALGVTVPQSVLVRADRVIE